MIIKEIAEFWIEDCLFKLANFSYSDYLPADPADKELVIHQRLFILAQQETFSWIPIDTFNIKSTSIDLIINQAKAYCLEKSIDCLKHDFKNHVLFKPFYQCHPFGIRSEQLVESKTKHILSFGKYKGQVLEDVMQIDPNYIFQIIENVAVFKDKFEKAVDNIWDNIMCEKSEARNNFENL